jgi:hypothetical protein
MASTSEPLGDVPASEVTPALGRCSARTTPQDPATVEAPGKGHSLVLEGEGGLTHVHYGVQR